MHEYLPHNKIDNATQCGDFNDYHMHGTGVILKEKINASHIDIFGSSRKASGLLIEVLLLCCVFVVGERLRCALLLLVSIVLCACVYFPSGAAIFVVLL